MMICKKCGGLAVDEQGARRNEARLRCLICGWSRWRNISPAKVIVQEQEPISPETFRRARLKSQLELKMRRLVRELEAR